jgi:hypothetical protein
MKKKKKKMMKMMMIIENIYKNNLFKNIYRIYINEFLDLLPDDLIEVINKRLIETEINEAHYERREGKKKRKKIQKKKENGKTI